MQVRRVRRIIRKIDPWTVLKVSLVFNIISGLVFVLGMWVMWSIAVQRGIPEGVADIFESLTLTFTPDGELYFRALVLLTVILVVVATAAMTLGAVLYNLISDLVGGVELTVLEETYLPVRPRRELRRELAPRRPPAVVPPKPVQAAAAPPVTPDPSRPPVAELPPESPSGPDTEKVTASTS